MTPDQRYYYYLLEAERSGIHAPILAALQQVQAQPHLEDGETGLGISPANRVTLQAVNNFPAQVQYAANAIRSLVETLIAQKWTATELWQAEKDRYTERLIRRVAQGYVPGGSEPDTARLEPCNADRLLSAYMQALAAESQGRPENLNYLDRALLSLVERIPEHYKGLPHQREALLEAARIWRRLDGREEAIASLLPGEAPPEGLQSLDPASIAFAQRLPQHYQGRGYQRNALVEAFRLWRQLGSRAEALAALGFDSAKVGADSTAIAAATNQLDRELLDFARRLPVAYKEIDHQREALIRLVQLWRRMNSRQLAIASLWEDLKQLDKARISSQEAPPLPAPLILPRRPQQWTPDNIQLSASIIPDGNFTWAEATHGGTRMPPDKATVDAVVRIAQLAQRARDRLGRPLLITSWYRPPHINQAVGGATYSRHLVGDAIDFTCEGLTGNQIYWFLEPWWPGGLGRYVRFPYLCHIDARSYRARWQH